MFVPSAAQWNLRAEDVIDLRRTCFLTSSMHFSAVVNAFEDGVSTRVERERFAM